LDCQGKLEQRSSGDYYKEQSMIRNLKVLVAAAMALAAFGAVSASGAQAAEFHCSVEPCTGVIKPDGTGKTSHHVFIVEIPDTSASVSFTCNSLSGGSTTTTKKTFTEVEVGGAVGAANALKYNECTVNGSPGVEVDMNGCKYNFTAAGHVTITGCTNAAAQIEITVTTAAGKCTFDIPEKVAGVNQTLTTVSYHLSGSAPTREVTVETNVHGIVVNATGTAAACQIDPTKTLTGTYTTGNTLITGQTSAGVMADAWYE
jgi:hypothetical protein